MSIFEIGWLSPNRHTVLDRPAEESVIRNIAPDDAVNFVKIHWSLAPDGAGSQALKHGIPFEQDAESRPI
jgi:hypothetical protein